MKKQKDQPTPSKSFPDCPCARPAERTSTPAAFSHRRGVPTSKVLLALRSQPRVRSALPSECPPGQALSAHLRGEAPPGPGEGQRAASCLPLLCIHRVQPSPAEAPQVKGKGQSWGQPEGGVNCHRALGVRSAGPALVGRCGQTAYLQACQNLQQPKREPRIFGHTHWPTPAGQSPFQN